MCSYMKWSWSILVSCIYIIASTFSQIFDKIWRKYISLSEIQALHGVTYALKLSEWNLRVILHGVAVSVFI